MMNLTLEQHQSVVNALYRTWEAIASDAVSEGLATCNAEALELCIDADRLRVFGGDGDAATLLYALCAHHGYGAVHAYFNAYTSFEL